MKPSFVILPDRPSREEMAAMHRCLNRLAEIVRKEPGVIRCPDGTMLEVKVWTPPSKAPKVQ